jgi:hypothetical protein
VSRGYLLVVDVTNEFRMHVTSMEDGDFTAVPGSYLTILLLISSSQRCFVLNSIHPFTDQVGF